MACPVNKIFPTTISALDLYASNLCCCHSELHTGPGLRVIMLVARRFYVPERKYMRVFTSGGRILQMPVFSAMGRILLINPKGSEKSSQLGSKTGHSGGGTNSANADMSVCCRWNSHLNSMWTENAQSWAQQSVITCKIFRLGELPPCPLWSF